MFDNLIDEYWDKFQTLIVRIKEPENGVYEKSILQIYEERADRFNYRTDYNYSAKSLFAEVCKDIMIKILDEQYVLKHIVMREETYQLYHYYEDNYPPQLCPSFEIFKKGAMYPIASITSYEWRWWVDEMGY